MIKNIFPAPLSGFDFENWEGSIKNYDNSKKFDQSI